MPENCSLKDCPLAPRKRHTNTHKEIFACLNRV